MNCDISKEQLVEYLYNDDLHSQDHEHLKIHIESCESCRKTVAELQATSNMLKAWPDEMPNLNMVFVEERQSFVPQIIKRHPWRWASGLAATLAATLILSFLNFEFAYRNGTFHVALGLQSDTPQTVANTEIDQPAEVEEIIYEVSGQNLNAPATQADLVIYQQTTLALAERLIRESEMRQRDDINSTFIHLIRDLEQQRQQDLQNVNHGIQTVYTTSQQNYAHLQQQWTRTKPIIFKKEIIDSIPTGFRPTAYPK